MIDNMDMGGVLSGFEVPVNLDTYTLTSVNFVQTMTRTARVPIMAVVQPSNRDKLAPLGVDMTLRHIDVHAVAPISVGQYINFNGQDYKVITPGDFQLYGFSEVVCAEVKGSVT